MKHLACLLIGVLFATPPALGQDAVSDHVGTFGFGFFTSDAPVGIRYWASPSFGLDIGVGFKVLSNQVIDEDGEDVTPPTKTSLYDFAVEAGIVFPMASEENMILFFRPGLGLMTEARIVTDEFTREQARKYDNTFRLNAMIGAELFLGRLGFPNLSFEGGYGVELTSFSPAEGGDSTTYISTGYREVNLVRNATLGFHIYLD